jgi:outer membrane protein assembly factor BamB
MQIKTSCPQCESTWQVDAGLKGKRVRCPNKLCRAIFEIKEAEAPPPLIPPVGPVVQPAAPAGRSGSVSEMIGVLPAEMATPAAAPLPAAVPIGRPAAPSPPGLEPASASPGKSEPFWDEMFSGAAPTQENVPNPTTWDSAPPVRQGASASPALPPINGSYGLAPLPDLHHETPGSKTWPWLVTGTLTMLAIACVGVAVWFMTATQPTDEIERATLAEKEYKDRGFKEAAALYIGLERDFPNSEQAAVYHFMAELSERRDAIERVQTSAQDIQSSQALLDAFLQYHKESPLLKAHVDDIATTLYRLVQEMTAFAVKDKNAALLADARQINTVASKDFRPPPPTQAQMIAEAFTKAEDILEKAATRERVLAELKAIDASPSFDGMERAEMLVKQFALAEDQDIADLLKGLPERHRQSIRFDPELGDDSVGEERVDRAPSMAVGIGRLKGSGEVQSPNRPVLSLMDGVLYAFDPDTSDLLWARRVGVDTSTLPVEVPATAVAPEMVLVAASEEDSLLALDAHDGSVLWRLLLPEPVVGEPVVMEGRAWVAGRAGGVYEIELAGGRCLGGFQLGQSLSHGGVRQPGTVQIFFAADKGCIYLLDVAAPRRCVGILYSNHQRGSVRVPPVIVPLPRGEGEALDSGKAGPPAGKLILCIDDGKQHTRLEAFTLPIADFRIAPTSVGDRLPGRVGFAPYFDGENLSLVTDTGHLVVYGVRQRDDRDPDLFLMHRESLTVSASAGDRPQVLYGDGQSYWVLAQSRLHLLRAGLNVRQGWKIAEIPVGLGPFGPSLQKGQVRTDAYGRPIIYFATQAPNGRAATLSSLDLEAGALRWQRNIGLSLAAPPVVAGGKIFAEDHRGTVLFFSPETQKTLPDGWLLGGRPASSELRGYAGALTVLPHSDDRNVTIVAATKQQAKLWNYADGVESSPKGPFALEAAPAGEPVLLGDSVVIPLVSNHLIRISGGTLNLEGRWRSDLADPSAIGHAAAVASDLLATTDGSRGIYLWRATAKEMVRIKNLDVKARILSAPAVLVKQGGFQLVVADAGRGVTLLEGETLRKVREWTVSEDIVGGPFIREGRILLVVGHRTLLCLDPDSDKPLWRRTLRGDIVGQPQLIEGRLIAADESGRITALDPATGLPVGIEFRIQADVAPAAAPVPWGPDRLFVPLTDGTVLLPARAWFRPSILGFPVQQ